MKRHPQFEAFLEDVLRDPAVRRRYLWARLRHRLWWTLWGRWAR